LLSAAGPPPEIGMPPVHNYYARDYKGNGQAWTILQDRRGVMLLGEGGDQVRTYDGAVWRNVFVPTTVIRSLAMDEAGRVWVGAVAQFGYLEADSSGTLHYVSIVDKIAPEDRGFTDVWQVLSTAQGVYFLSYERLFRWDGQHMHVWRTKSRFHALSLVRGRVYTAQGGIGLQEIVGDELREAPGGAAYRNAKKLFLHPYDGGRILTSERDGLLTLYDGQKAVPFPTQADEYLKAKRLYTSLLLPDGGICLTTIQGGVVLANHDGSLRRILDKGTGLLGDGSYSAYVDREGALWVGQIAGVSRVEIGSPVSIFTHDVVPDIARFHGSLYATAASGLTPIARLVSDRTGAWTLQGLKTDFTQAWTMLVFRDPFGRGQDQLLAITSAGVMKIDGDRAIPAIPDVHSDHEAGAVLIQSRKTPARVFIAHFDGLSSIRWDGRRWINEGRLPNAVYRFSTLTEDDDGVLWAGGSASEGLAARIEVSPEGLAASKVRLFSGKDGLIGGDISVEFAGGGLYAMPNYSKQAYRWDKAAGRFVVDNRFLLPLDGPGLAYSLWAAPAGEVWSLTGSGYVQRLALFRRKADGNWVSEEEPYRLLARSPINSLRFEPGIVWSCSSDGLIRYDRNVKLTGQKSFPTLVGQVSAGPRIVFGGAAVSGAAAPRLPHDRNSVRFEYAAPAFGNESETVFQCLLEGADRDWSAWSKQTEANYSNLGPGSYRFRVRSRTLDGRTGGEGSFSFIILPPWYRTWWAWTLYALLLAAAGYGLAQLFRRRLIQRERERSQIREAELRAETAAAQAQVLQSENERKKNVELLSDIGREITASLDLETILFKLYERVNEILDATIFGVGLYRPQEQVIEYTLAIENGKRYAPYTRDMRDKNQFAVWCIEHRQPLMMNDVEAEASKYVPSYRHDSDLLLEDGSIAQPPASMMYLPLVAQDRVLGVLSVQSFKKNAYTEQHLSLLENLAAYTTIALDNAGAYRMVAEREREIRSQAAELATINQITQALSTQLNMERLIPLVGDQVRDLFHAPIVYLALLDRAAMTINFPYTFGEESQSLPFGQGLTSQIIRTGQPLLLNEDLDGSASRMGVHRLGRHASAYLGVPIPSGGEMIGVISVQSIDDGRRFTEADQRLLATVASAVGVAIHNAKLFEDARQARAAAEEADAAKSSFLSTVSHELRTPLTSVLGFAKIIRRRLEERLFPLIPEDDRKVQQAKQQVISNLGVVVSEGERLTKLIDDVLDLAKIEAGKFSWNMTKISVSEVLERAIGATSSLFEAKKLDLVRRIEPELPEITGDRDRLIQVVINLISNAVKFTDSGAIECSACVRGGELVVSVTDNGIGIAPADQGKVFEKFKQVGDTLTDKPKGTGLGLPICKEIVEYHGGRIWVESEPGKGSTFSFAIPLPDGAGPVPRTIDIESLVRQLREKVASHEPRANSILVVDDDPNIRSLLQQEFTENGYSVRLAENGRRALELVREETPGLIVLDVMMPEMNGFDVAAVLKNDPVTMDIPIIILSIVEDKERGLRLGVDRYLTKPIDTATLFREVGALLEQGKSKKKVMVVDEDASTVRTLVNVLEARGYQVVESNGEELVADAVLAKPDIIILNSLLSSNRGVRSLRFEKGLENVLFLIYQ
jgi:signal transduction histidine kinase/CheY-like chemotaxis protein